MLTQIKQILAAPAFEDEEKTRVARLVNNMAQAIGGIALIGYSVLAVTVGPLFWKDFNNLLFTGLALALALLVNYMTRRGNVQAASVTLISALWVIVTFVIYTFGWTDTPTASAYLLCISLAGLLLGGRGAIICTGFSVLAILYAGYIQGFSTAPEFPPPASPLSRGILYSTIFVMGGFLMQYAANSITRSLQRARSHERVLAEHAREMAVFHALADRAPSAIVLVSLEGKITYANRAWCELYGYDYDSQEMIGLDTSRFWTAQDMSLLTETIRPQTLADSWRGEVRQQRKDGSLFVSSLTAFPVCDGAGKAISRAGIIQDITQRKQAEKALRESEELYRSLVETSPDAITLTDLDGNVIVGNQQSAILYGLENIDEGSGQNAFEFIAPEDRARAMANMHKALETGSVRNVEYTFLKKDGAQFTGELSASFVLDAEGKPKSFIGIVRDITQRKQAEEAMRESEERFRAVSELVSDFAYSVRVEADGAIVPEWETTASSRVTGYTPDEVVERGGWQILIHPDDLPLALQHLQIHLGGQPDVQEYRIVTKSGETRWLRDYGRPVWDKALGRVVRILGAAQDVTERKRIEEALRESEERYRRLVDLSPVGIAVHQEGKMTFANPACAKLLGAATPGELVGRPILDLAPPDYRQIITERIRQIAVGQDVPLLEERFIRLDEREIDVEVSAIPFVHEGKPAIHVVFQDITARKQAEKALRESEARYKLVTELMSDYVFRLIIDPGGRVAMDMVTDNIVAITGRTLQEIQTPDLWTKMIHPGDLENVMALMQTLITTGGSVDIECRALVKDGSLRWVQVVAQAVQDQESRQTVAIVGAVKNITRRKQAEEALRESEEKFRGFIEQSSEGISLADEQGRIVEWNQAMEHLLGLKRDQVIGMPVWEVQFRVLPPELRVPERYESNRLGLLNALQTGQSYAFDHVIEAELCRTDGEKKIIQQAAFPIRTDKGYRMGSVLRDITARKQAEEVLRESEERFRALIEHSHDAVTLLAADGTVLYDSPSIARVLGYDPTERVGRSVCEFVVPEERQGMAQGLADFARQAGAIALSEVRFLHKDGAPRQIEGMRTNLLHNPAVKAIVVNYRDVTERKQAEEALRRYAVELEARNQDLDAFSHMVAHDIKNTLVHVVGNAEMLETNYDKLSESETEKCLRSIVHSGRRINNIVDELMLLAGVRKMEVEGEPLDMAGIVAGALQRLSDMTERSRAEIQLPRYWPVAFGYGPWVEEVWVNYISNAISYGGQPPWLELGWNEVKDESKGLKDEREGQPDSSLIPDPSVFIRFWVRDNGAGIAPEDQVRLFTPFTQLHKIRTKGHGLGLSIVRRIVEKLGGQVGITSQVGQGSVFSFTLPRAPTD